MPGYNAALEIYYCKQSENPGDAHRIAPSPLISINPEIYYANDSIIGYTYNITLSGYANALRKEIDAGSMITGLAPTIDHMGDIRDIFNTNGGNLYIKQNGQNILIAKGATVKSINFNTSDNRWVNYSPFTIELEFNELDFLGCSNNPAILCNNSFFNASSLSSNLIDIKKYKIKEFSDKWSFVIDNQIYQNNNNIFKVTYTLSATGKNYYIEDNLVPAWQQAKMFVQERLFDQVLSLINGILQIVPDNEKACEPTDELSDLYSTDYTPQRSDGLISQGQTLRDGTPKYDIYNEYINCSTSESDGTFSITYNATIKKYNANLNPVENAAIHTYTKNITTNMGSNKNVTINIEGNIQGLTRGGFIYYNNDFSLPKNGTFISTIDSAETRYSNAYNYFNTMVGSSSDLLSDFKNLTNIKPSSLLINTQCTEQDNAQVLRPTSFTVDHSYTNGSINYSASYDTSTSSTIGKGYSNISIIRNDPVEIVQEFVIPGRLGGPIIQKLGMKTNRTVSITIEGASPDNKSCICFSELDPCNGLPVFDIPNFEKLLESNGSWVKTKEDYTSNKIDGSYSISLEYLCKG